MRVPTTDYSPLMNAKAQQTQARRSGLIAKNINYQTESMKLQEKGLDATLSHITQQQMWNEVSYGYNTAKNMVMTAVSAAAAKQMASSQAMGSQMANNWQTQVAQMVADGELYVDANADIDTDPTHNTAGKTGVKIVGLDKLQQFQDQQIQAIKDQGWMPSIEKSTISAMQRMYSGGEQKILQDFYVKETSDRFKLEQLNLDNAITQDIADYKSTGYTNFDNFVSGLKGYTPKAMEIMTTSGHAQIDLGRAANDVREIATTQGSAAGVARANAISDERGYDPDTRTRLINYANHAAAQAKDVALAQGTMFMEQALQTAQNNNTILDGEAARKQADNATQGMPKEQKAAYELGMQRVQLTACHDFLTGLTENVGDVVTSSDIKNMKDALKANKSMFMGDPAAKELYNTTMANLDKADALETSKEFDQQYATYEASILGPLMEEKITPAQALDRIKDIKGKDNASPDEIAMAEKLTEKVYGQTKAYADPAIKQVRESIKNSYQGMYGTDFLRKQGPEYDALRVLYQANLMEADGKIMDLCLNKGNLSPAQIEMEAQKIRDDFINQNALIFKDIDTSIASAAQPAGVKTSPAKGGKAAAPAIDPAIGDIAEKYASAAKTLKSQSDSFNKKEDQVSKDKSVDFEKQSNNMEAIGKSTEQTMGDVLQYIRDVEPSKEQPFTKWMEDNYYKFKANPGLLDDFADMKLSGNPPKVVVNDEYKNFYIKTDDSYEKMIENKGTSYDDLYISVQNTPQGQEYFAKRTSYEEQMLTKALDKAGISGGTWHAEYVMPEGYFLYSREESRPYGVKENYSGSTVYYRLNKIDDNRYEPMRLDDSGWQPVQLTYKDVYKEPETAAKTRELETMAGVRDYKGAVPNAIRTALTKPVQEKVDDKQIKSNTEYLNMARR